MDCGVEVFSALTNLTRDEILHDMPESVDGKTVDEWKAYLETKGFEVIQYSSDESFTLPCAHLVGTHPDFCHWIYHAPDGGIHDPGPVNQCMPPMQLTLAHFGNARILSIAVYEKRSTNEKVGPLSMPE